MYRTEFYDSRGSNSLLSVIRTKKENWIGLENWRDETNKRTFKAGKLKQLIRKVLFFLDSHSNAFYNIIFNYVQRFCCRSKIAFRLIIRSKIYQVKCIVDERDGTLLKHKDRMIDI